MNLIEIHEFSTGIQVQGTPDNWYSTGFTGSYMNQTIDPIPVPVRKAIANLEFDIGVPTPEPAILGREILSNLEIWSVVAIITQGRDDRGRPFPLYRYFLAKSTGNLRHILSWILQQQIQRGQLPTFDPFDSKTLGQPNCYDTVNTKTIQLTPKFQAFLTQDPPIIIPFDQPCSAIILNTLATYKSQQNGEPVSWAHQVEGLTKPLLFQVIQPASTLAQQQLQNAKTTITQSSAPSTTIQSPSSQTTVQTRSPQKKPLITLLSNFLKSFLLRLQPMRIYLYALAGTGFILIGWNVAHFFLTDLAWLQQFPGLIIFPCIAIFLAVGMVINEIFISNPTRLKLNLSVAVIPLLIAVIIGLFAGTLAGGLYSLIHNFDWSVTVVRTVSWLLVGAAVGFSEGLTWQFYSLEAGDRRRKIQRLWTSLIGASIASLVAAWLFEISLETMPSEGKNWQEPLGFGILGLVIGLTLSIANSPSYLAALRAGKGFEYTGDYDQNAPRSTYPHIQPTLKFVSHGQDEIEEGLSIQLPAAGIVRIGSSDKADIFLPGVPLHVANLALRPRDVQLEPNPQHCQAIEVNGSRLRTSDPRPLKHNNLLTFHSQTPTNPHGDTIYRFVYYNRFLDPQA